MLMVSVNVIIVYVVVGGRWCDGGVVFVNVVVGGRWCDGGVVCGIVNSVIHSVWVAVDDLSLWF